MGIGDFPHCIDCGARLPATTWRPRRCLNCQTTETKEGL